jgi:hypothetical protein
LYLTLDFSSYVNKTLSPETTFDSVLLTYWTSNCKFFSAEQKVLQILVSSNDLDHAEGNVELAVLMPLRRPLVMIAKAFVEVLRASHMVWYESRFTHRLHPRGLELSMSMMQIWQCIDHLHVHHLHSHPQSHLSAIFSRRYYSAKL